MSTDTLLQIEQRLIDEARPYAVVTVIRASPPTSTWVGAQALVDGDSELHGWIGGGCARAIVIQAALDAMRTGLAKRIRISNEPAPPEADVEMHAMPCASNGTIELFIQPTLPPSPVLVLGSTPTALEACVLAQRMGFRVYAAASVSAPFAGLGVARALQGFDAGAFESLRPQLILVATQGDCDEEALEAALRTSAAAVLLIASKRKAEKLRDAMRLRGIGEERLKALCAPAGPSIHARTPQEIALGAVAGLVTLHRELELAAAGADPGVSRSQVADDTLAVLPCESIASIERPAARYVNPVCGMPVDIATAKHIVDCGGQRVYFCCDCCRVEFDKNPGKFLAIAQAGLQREAS